MSVYVDDSTEGTPATPARQPTDRAATTLAERMADVAVITNAVNAGELTIDPETGARLLDTLRQQADATGDWLEKLRGMSRPVPLGTNWVGEAMSGKFERRAEGEDVSSFAAVLTQYQQTLLQAHGAVDEAMRRYQNSDEESANVMRRIAGTDL